MKIFSFTFRTFLIAIILISTLSNTYAESDTTKLFQRTHADTSKNKLNMDAAYNRPFLTSNQLPIAIGGYLEVNTHYAETDGISEGFSFQARRFTLFFSSTISKKIKFLSELEFEDGTREINIEFAAIDFEFHPLLNLRGGIVMNPIGAYNQNHDGPNWDFVERPISTTSIIPTTLSNVGFGLHGQHYVNNWIFGYETYLTNGFDDKIISNEDGRTSLAAGKSHPDKFEKNNSGLPMFTGKLAFRNISIGELGVSYMNGVYNKWMDDGEEIDDKRSVSVVAVDFNTSLLNDRLNITTEIAKVFVDIPETYTQQYGSNQTGGYIDFVGTIIKRKMFDWENAKINLGVRLEYVDYNQDQFIETGDNIADDIWAIVPSIAFRPVGPTVIRLNYRYEQQRDLLGNPPANTGAIQFGISTYF